MPGVPRAFEVLVEDDRKPNEPWLFSLPRPMADYVPLLPFYYNNLDPANIPSPRTVETMYAASEGMQTAASAAFALVMIAKMRKLPKDAYPDIWSRAWPWIQFFHTYHPYLVAIRLPDKHALFASFVEICVSLQANGLASLVAETPGVRVVVAAAWNMIPDDGLGRDSEVRESELKTVSLFICLERRRKPHMQLAIEEYLEGAGGSVNSLASMIVRHLNHASASDPMSDDGATHFTAAVGIMRTVNEAEDSELSHLFDAELRRHGLIRAVTRCVCSINSVATNHANGVHLIAECFNILGHHSSLLTHGRTSTSQALQSGLLRALVLVASTHAGNTILEDQVRSMLGILPGHMVYRSILQHMRKCLREVEDLVDSEAFAASTLFPVWPFFDALVRERLEFLDTFDATSATYKACDNTMCSKVFAKSELRRCSMCLELYYCSRSCQTVDWRAGHRERCQRFSALRRLPEENQCSKSDRAFMRALMHKDYLAQRTKIFAQEVALLKQDPAALWVVRFDYHIDGHAIIDVVLYTTSLPVLPEIQHFSSDWLARHHDHAIRVARGGCWVTMHMMSAFGGFKHHWKIFPQRQVSGERSIRELLWGIVQTVADMPNTDPEYETTVAAGIRTLTDMDLDFIYE
ncbi:hypothetical protein DFH06DRAFT_1304335 [Mycena polygramma]|nr:hypothetical protein DFH06DRAFT_1304335 [Mycena polygramma]